jgi:purine catabolism regulator
MWHSGAETLSIPLRRLFDEPTLALRHLGGPGDAETSWVHSSDLDDPTPFLAPGHTLLTTGTQFDEQSQTNQFQPYTRRLAHAGIVAVGFGTEVVRAETPPGLVRSCVDVGLTIFEVPYATPFIAVIRWVAEELSAQAHARQDWALAAQRSLALAALSRGRLDAVLGELARRLPATVALYDAYGELMARHTAEEIADPSSPPGQVESEVLRMLHRGERSASALQDTTGRTHLQTLGRRGELRGVMTVVQTEPADAAATSVLTSAVALAEFALENLHSSQSRQQKLHSQLLSLVLRGHRDAVDETLADEGCRLPSVPFRVVVADLPGQKNGDLELAARPSDYGSPETSFAAMHEGRLLFIVRRDSTEPIVASLHRRGFAVGVSQRSDYQSIGVAVAHAHRAVDDAMRRRPLMPVYAPTSEASPLSSLALPEVAAMSHAKLDALSTRPEGLQMRRAVEAWLQHNTQWEPAARDLGIHRHTVKALVRDAAKLLEIDIDTFAGKAELWALLQADRMAVGTLRRSAEPTHSGTRG